MGHLTRSMWQHRLMAHWKACHLMGCALTLIALTDVLLRQELLLQLPMRVHELEVQAGTEVEVMA